MTTPPHESLREDLALYALGALDAVARASFESHLASCETCQAELRQLTTVVESLARAVPQIDPPAALRDRVLAEAVAPAATSGPTVSHGRQGVRWGWLAAAAALTISVGLAGYAWRLQGRIDDLAARLASAERTLQATRGDVVEARRALDAAQSEARVLLAPDVLRVALDGQPRTPSAVGRAYFSPTTGLLLTASNLPRLPENQVYQLWAVTSSAPVSAGLLSPDASGTVVALFPAQPGAPSPVAFAVTIEPAGGVPAPTGERALVGLVTS